LDLASIARQPVAEPGLASDAAAPRRRDFLGVPIDCLTLDETIAAADRAIQSRRLLQHGCLNVAKFVAMRHDSELDFDVRSSHVVSVDGVGIFWASRLLGLDVPERVAGVDVMQGVLGLCANRGYRPYFLGARLEIVEAAVAEARRLHPELVFAGWRDGYFAAADEAQIVAAIRAAQPDCLFIGLPTPRKERFLARHRDALGVPFVMGVGGGLDVLAGHVRRAPRWVQVLGLEWLFRTLQEPMRLGPRYARTNPRFAAIVLTALIGRVAARRIKQR
jgi:N-acetylglucosaminyldiphosphoundecaprenol N-acetyl-beta-D-mannosaminyltransferase